MKLGWAASLVGMSGVLAAGCGGSSEQAQTPEPRTVLVTVEKTVEVTAQQSTTSATATSGTTSSDAADVTCQVGQECDLGGSTVTVTSAQQTQTISTSLGDTFEGNFVVVEFDYTYCGNSPEDTGEPPFQLSDSEGNMYSLHFAATSAYGIDNDRSLIYTTVQPGVPAPGTAIFEVFSGAEGFTLLVEDFILPETGKVAKIPL